MTELHLPKNIKVHFAGCEVQNQFIGAMALGVTYGLYTCYPWVERKIFAKPKSPIMPLRWQKEDTERLIPKYIEERAHLKFGEHLRLGFVLDLTYFGEFHATPMFGIRWDI